MTRQLKFRAWWKEAKLMADVEVWRESDIVIIVPIISSIPGHIFERQMLDAGDYEIMQWTGLLDKNGNPIFEGDIVKYESEKGIQQGYIDFNSTTASYVIDYWKNGQRESNADMLYEIGDVVEIIGNIYQNTDLLTNQS